MAGGSYFLGVLAAIAADIALNPGMVVQKVAVTRVRDGAGLMRQQVGGVEKPGVLLPVV